MRRIHHVLPCGAIYSFRQYGYRDFAKGLIDYMFENIPRQIANDISNGNNHGRKRIPWGTAIYAKIMNTLWSYIVEHLLEADRVIITHKKMKLVMYIGQVPDNPHRMSKRYRKLPLHFATEGKRYTILLDGLKHSYYFRMTQRNRRRLYQNIVQGKNYH